MRLTSIELSGFKSFARKTALEFSTSITSVVGPNGSGKSNIAESFRFVLGEQSMKSMRGRRGEDMIWNGSAAVPRGSRAGVKLVFDNSDRALNLDFDQVTLERVVHRDGVNEYLLNGSQVRLRDISELLAQANIGASGHHIISQGEADHILTSSSKDRREMLEDALGLTAYLYKREDAVRKLDKTAENMKEVEALRRELMPHLKFLASQVRKIEEAGKLREDVAGKYVEYLKRESVYLRVAQGQIAAELEHPEAEHAQLAGRIAQLRQDISHNARPDDSSQKLMALEEEGRTAAHKRDQLTRELGRVEGELAAAQRIVHTAAPAVPQDAVQEYVEVVTNGLEESLQQDETQLRSRVAALILVSKDFLRRMVPVEAPRQNTDHLQARVGEIERELAALHAAVQDIVARTAALRSRVESDKDASREAEKELFAAMARRSELDTTIARLRSRLDMLAREHEEFRREMGEAGALLGNAIVEYDTAVVYAPGGEAVSESDIADEDRAVQLERRRKLERQKIRLEELGAGNSAEVLKEHAETTERDQFLARELEDLEVSAAKLRDLVAELSITLDTRFNEGIQKIKTEFDTFFKLMFGGGTAALSVVEEKKLRRGAEEGDTAMLGDDDTEVQEGIDISISLPHKRIKGLHMLSGGERALTSIALIFAMSQVNPPPFLILDETDAALDEANSRRYGDMIENLARRSQLIVITHNRETMSRAGILYGVTMGSDGVSKLLSVKFKEAVAVAK
jgi:chromosome segregation ATPase